jgi:acyl-CoA dehydrogenase family protein 9
MRDEPYEKVLRDIRVFPIFEGANDVLRAFIALTGAKPLAERLSGLGELDLADPLGSLGVVIDYVSGRIQREVRPERVTRAHTELSRQADAVGDQVKRLRDVTEGLLRRHGKGIVERQFQQKRLSGAISDIFAQIALLSRVTSILDDQGAEVSGQEIYIADTFCTRAAGRVQRSFDQIEDNDDERMVAIAKLALRRGEYGYALFED